MQEKVTLRKQEAFSGFIGYMFKWHEILAQRELGMSCSNILVPSSIL